jgi:hypothetical protein
MEKDHISKINKTTHLLPHHSLTITTMPHHQVEVTATTHPNLYNRVAMVPILHRLRVVDIPALLVNKVVIQALLYQANKVDMGNSSSIIHRTATSNSKEIILLHQDISQFHSHVFN